MSRLNEVDERTWGRYKVTDYQDLSDGLKAMTKIIEIDTGKNISYQFHHDRDEVWTIIDGFGYFANGKEIKLVYSGDTISIPRGTLHAIKCSDLCDGLKFYEVQYGTELREDDIERLTTDWNEIKNYLKLFHG